MNSGTRDVHLSQILPAPWARGDMPIPPLFSPRQWRRVGSELCLLVGLMAFAVAVVALRLTVYGQTVVAPHVAGALAIAAGAVCVLALVSSNYLRGRDEPDNSVGPLP